MKKIPIWLDTDTGVDDAFAILAALRSENAWLVGSSSVVGNVSHSKTFVNARNVLAHFGHPEIKVHPGADSPLVIQVQDAAYIHGNNGLGGVILPESKAVKETVKAWDAIYEAARTYEGMEIVAVGPLTNIALALMKYPDLKDYVNRIVIMGGSAEGGAWTPCAEFNICVDPHAAEIVMNCGIPIVMFGLDVTLKAYMDERDMKEIAAMKTDAGRLFTDCMGLATIVNSKRIGKKAVAVHDVLPVLSYDHPELFTGVKCGLHIETRGTITLGRTVTDIWSETKFPEQNAEVILKVDRERFAAIFKDILRS